ncbi:alpha/beta fold hydrolase [Dyella soli]|uniref:Alpha/beta fold hydrolase n=1 Tax=Dyella soli TaxID=522319 RepID=A0A4V2NLU4_9GAMM|nr:alpha/beta fold hydrolase [Dyella soli]TCI10461.1 alpha/beta fold hydrolase [Dyella soli]
MREQAFRFGRARHLIGIAGLPDARPGAVGVIVLNAGLVHRVGPFRMNVDMTRRLNQAGYPTLRFDFSTVGDSGSSGESQSRVQQVCADVDDAMDLLRQHAGCARFVLVGLCSGAQNAHTVACNDDKVAGAVFLDGYAYRTLGFKLRHYLPRVLDAGRWRRWFARRAKDAADGESDAVFSVAPSPRTVVCADLAGMIDRGLKLCLVYSGGINMYFNHPRQFRECFGNIMASPAVSTRYIEETDHTYVLASDRRRLIDHIEAWLCRNFPIVPTGASS